MGLYFLGQFEQVLGLSHDVVGSGTCDGRGSTGFVCSLHPSPSAPSFPYKFQNHPDVHQPSLTHVISFFEMFTPPLTVARARALSPAEIERPNADPGGLESSLIQLMQDHHQTSLKLRDEAGQFFFLSYLFLIAQTKP